MRPPIPRFVRWTVVLAVIAALVVAVVQYWNTQQPVASGAPDSGWTQTQWGPLGPADRDMLIKVRQAGLWEMPTGQQAQQQASSERVREVGGLISAEHADLDAQVRGVAAQLGVLLPNQPSDQQQAWMAEIAGQSGSDFDRVFVQRLRAAHGKVLPVLAEVRAGTRNEMVRAFASTAATFVTRHHEYLESTGLVDFSALPEPPAPAAGAPPAAPPAAPVPAAATAPAPAAAAGVGLPAGHEQHVNQVAQASAVGGGGVYVAALVYIASLLAIVGLLCLLGNAGLRARRNRSGPRRAGRPSRQSGAHTAPQPRVEAAAAPLHVPPQPTVHVPPQPTAPPSPRTRSRMSAQPSVQPPPQSRVQPSARSRVQPVPPPAARMSPPRPARTSAQPAAHPSAQPAMHTSPPRPAQTSRGMPARPRHAAQRW